MRSGDQFEQLTIRALIERSNENRTDELVTLVRAAGVTAGQTMALILGADPNHVAEWGQSLLGGE